jgi:SHS2 domain-containing protein
MPDQKDRKFTVLDHSGDLRIAARGHDNLEALANAAAGLISEAVDPDRIDETEERSVIVQGDDEVEQTIAFLNELIFLIYARHWIPKRVRTLTRCRRKGCREVEAVLVGEPVDPARHEFKYDIKAVTYHDFQIRRENDEVVIEFVCDL